VKILLFWWLEFHLVRMPYCRYEPGTAMKRGHRLYWVILVLAVFPPIVTTACGQTPGDAPLILPLEASRMLSGFSSPSDLHLNFRSLLPDTENSATRPDRFQLFRMPTGFLINPVGLDSDDDDPVNGSDLPTALSPGEDRLQVLFGQDNPFFDFRYRGDPGGIGFYRLHAQYQLFDSNSSGLCLGLRAVTPAGLEAEGLAQGRTILSPALSWYQDLGSDFVLHGFVGKNVHASANCIDNLERSIHYGLAMQQPFPGLTPSPNCSLHMFVEALGRQRNSPDLVNRPASTFEMLPGLHWQLGENWWMQGGVLLPMGTSHLEPSRTSRLDSGLWQITCSWRF
jgi:hypothetical protein